MNNKGRKSGRRERFVQIRLICVISVLFLSVLLSVPAIAQQAPIFTQHPLNGYVLNPAKAGDNDNLNIFMFYRNQWTGMPGAPETMAITADGAIKDKKIGLGLNVTRDAANIIGQTSGMGTFSYFLTFPNDHSLSAGISLGFARNEIYFDRIVANNAADPSILNSTDSKTNFDADFGLNYKYKTFELGFTTKHLLASSYRYEKTEEAKALNYQLIRHYIINAKYQFTLVDDHLDVSPGLLFKSAQGLPVQYEVSVMAKWDKKVWLGVAYKEQFGFGAWFGAYIHPNIMVSYAYEYTTGKLASYANSTHEVVVGFVLSRDNKKAKHSKAKQKRDFNKVVQIQSEELDKLEQENQRLKELIKKNEDNISGLKEEVDRLKKDYNLNKDTIELVIEKYRYVEPTTDEEIALQDSIDHVNPSDYYVIVGTQLKVDNAKLLQKILQREKGLATRVVSREDNKYFFVYTNKFNTRKEAVKEIFRLRKLNIMHLVFGNIWIYKSEKE